MRFGKAMVLAMVFCCLALAGFAESDSDLFGEIFLGYQFGPSGQHQFAAEVYFELVLVHGGEIDLDLPGGIAFCTNFSSSFMLPMVAGLALWIWIDEDAAISPRIMAGYDFLRSSLVIEGNLLIRFNDGWAVKIAPGLEGDFFFRISIGSAGLGL